MSAVTPLIAAGFEAARMWMDYTQRAIDMTEEQAAAEWKRVAARVSQAEARWEASKPG